jgi:hypothetical protein
MSAKPIEVNWSHDRPRVELRRPSDGGTPPMPASAETAPIKDATTGRFVKGNQAHRRRSLKSKATGISTLNPATCASWLTPFVRDGVAYAMQLVGRFPDPALARLVGATCDAHVMYRALLGLAAQGDKQALGESRAWLREHRACLRELAALAGLVGGDKKAIDLQQALIDAARPRDKT